jgi:hypothetical protein
LLSGNVDWLLDPPGPYAASIEIERASLLDAPAVEVVIPPGQKHRRETTWTDLIADVVAGKYRGVILVTAYGHQSIARDSYKQHPLFAARKDDFVPALLAQQRADELTILDQVLAALRMARNRVWLLTVVAKQDLWWPDRVEAEKFYREGEYGRRVAGAFGEHGSRDRHHELCMASLVIQNWTTQTPGERLRPNAEGYDQTAQRNSIRRLLELIDALRRWEAES